MTARLSAPRHRRQPPEGCPGAPRLRAARPARPCAALWRYAGGRTTMVRVVTFARVLALSSLVIGCGLRPGLLRPGEEPLRPPLIVMLGDSTTAGTTAFAPRDTAPATPAKILQAALRMQPPGYLVRRDMDMSRAVVVDLSVPGARSTDWAVAPRKDFCNGMIVKGLLSVDLPSYAVLVAACRAHDPMVLHLRESVPRDPDVGLILLGTNDVWSAPAETVAHLAFMQETLRPATVLIASPHFARDERQRHLREVTEQLRAQGLLTGPDFNALPLATVYDGVHLTQGAYVAAAGLWLDAIRAIDMPPAAPPKFGSDDPSPP
jgi:hypothetical protein